MDGLKVALVLATTAGGLGRHVRSVADGLRARGAKVVVLGPSSADALFGFTASGTAFAPVEISDRPHPSERRTGGRAAPAPHPGRRRRPRARSAGRRAGRARPGPYGSGAAASRHGGPAARRHAAQRLHRGRPDRRGVRDARTRRRAGRGRGPGRLAGPGGADALAGRAFGGAAPLVPAPPAPPSDDPDGAEARSAPNSAPETARSSLTVARLAEQKGLPTLLDAAAGWARLDPAPLVRSPGTGRWSRSCATGSRPSASPCGCSAAVRTSPTCSPPPTSRSCRASGRGSR